MSSLSICLVPGIAGPYQCRLWFTSKLETGETRILYQIISTRMRLLKRNILGSSLLWAKRNFSIALNWEAAAIKWQKVLTLCIQLLMSLFYTLLGNWGIGILKRKRIFNCLKLISLCMNPLPRFLKIFPFCSEWRHILTNKPKFGISCVPSSGRCKYLLRDSCFHCAFLWRTVVKKVLE